MDNKIIRDFAKVMVKCLRHGVTKEAFEAMKALRGLDGLFDDVLDDVILSYRTYDSGVCESFLGRTLYILPKNSTVGNMLDTPYGHLTNKQRP